LLSSGPIQEEALHTRACRGYDTIKVSNIRLLVFANFF
jgi:hypothetical protein